MICCGKILAFVYVCLLAAAGSYADDFDHSHSLWTQLLQKVVVVERPVSNVAYATLIEHRRDLNSYLYRLQNTSRSSFDGFSQAQQLAFLINAYNAFQLRQVVMHYPVNSVKKIGYFYYSPWEMEFFQLFGRSTSLKMIERDLIRKISRDPRIHFTINCACVDCPPLLNRAYSASEFEQQLEWATTNFLSNSTNNYFIKEINTLVLSSLFSLYKDDFGSDLLDFVLPRLGSRISTQFGALSPSITFSDFDWSLNDTR